MSRTGLQRLLVGVTALALSVAIVTGAGRAGWLADASPPASSEPVAPDPRSLSERQIAGLQARLTRHPEDPRALAQLGQVYLQQVRESGDPAYYPRAEAALRRARVLDGGNVDALVGLGLLALSRHQFGEALAWGEQARALAPHTAFVYGVIGDAQIELGRYPEAVASFQRMVDLRPDLNSYARVSYARELHGQLPGAIDAMSRAVQAGVPGQEGTAWTRVQLGHLHFNTGALEAAGAEYERALREAPDYLHALAALGRVEAARGNYAAAIDLYRRATASIPLPEYVIALGDLYTVAGDRDAAEEQYTLVRVQSRLLAANGVNSDLELALFAADRPQPGMDPWQVVEGARAAQAARPTIYAHDALAWALYRVGDYDAAWDQIVAALKLGTQDATLYFHAGSIARARGDAATARRYFEGALRINPYFSLLHAPAARAALSESGS